MDTDATRPPAWTEAFERLRPRLLAIATQRLNPLLTRRCSPEDILQDTFAAAMKRPDYFESHPEVPVYFKLRTVLLQVLTDTERRHLKSGKRDAYRERDLEAFAADDSLSAPADVLDRFAASVTSPVSRVARDDRNALLRRAMAALPDADRDILTLRHFDGCGNTECAEILGITTKNASIRYVRALQRLRERLMAYTEFNL